MTAEQSLDQMRENLRQTQAELIQMLDAADLATLHHPHGEEKWTIAVMLAHLTEARSYFAKQVGALRKTPGVPMGRTLDNEQRTDAIIHAQQMSLRPEELKQRLLDSYDAVTRLFDSLSEADLQIACDHVRLGPMTLGEFLRRTFVEHDQAHVQQARGFLNV